MMRLEKLAATVPVKEGSYMALQYQSPLGGIKSLPHAQTDENLSNLHNLQLCLRDM